MSRKYPREGDCKRIGPRLERVADQLILYAERKRFLAPIMQELRERVPDPSKYPEEWASMVLAMIGAAAVTTVPKRTQGFVRSVQNLLAPEDLQLARQWRRVPWAFIAFETVEPVEHDIVLVEPIGAAPAGWPGDLPWERLPVYSPSLANAHSRGSRSGLALIAYDGALFHTYGVILNFASFSTDDLLYFASIAADDTTADELPFLLGAREDVPSISEVIRNDPLSFLLLFQWQGIPTVTGRAGAWRYCASMITYDGGEDLADEEVWRRVIAEAGHVIQDIVVTDEIVGIRLGEEGPMYEPLILVSLEDRAVYVRAMNDDAYARGVAAVAPLITIPSEPQVQASMAMMQAAEAILEPVDLLSDLEAFVSETFDGAGDLGGPAAESDGDLLEEDQKPPDIAVIQPVLDLLMEDFNEGRNYTDEMIAEKTGAEVEQVRMLREQVQAMMDRAPGGGAGGRVGGGAGGGRGGGAGNAPGGATRPAAERIKPADRFGLAPGPFHRIISSPVPAEKGVLALRDLREAVLTPGEQEALGSVALFRFARWMVGLEQIPATAAGYVAPSIVRRAIEEEIVPIYHDVFQMDLFNDAMPKKEIDAPVFNRYREVLEAAGLIRLDGKRFVVPARMRSADLGTIVSTITEAMFTSARWDTSRYGKPLPRLRESAGFLLYVVKRLSANERDGWVPVRAVYDAFLGAHPQLADQISPGDIQNPGSAGWWVLFNIRVHFVDLFGETLGVLEGNSPGAEGPSRATLPDLDSYLVRPSRRFSILFR